MSETIRQFSRVDFSTKFGRVNALLSLVAHEVMPEEWLRLKQLATEMIEEMTKNGETEDNAIDFLLICFKDIVDERLLARRQAQTETWIAVPNDETETNAADQVYIVWKVNEDLATILTNGQRFTSPPENWEADLDVKCLRRSKLLVEHYGIPIFVKSIGWIRLV